MDCENCKYYKKINQYAGYCTVREEQMKANNNCEDGEE